jgi:hypothetical protein
VTFELNIGGRSSRSDAQLKFVNSQKVTSTYGDTIKRRLSRSIRSKLVGVEDNTIAHDITNNGVIGVQGDIRVRVRSSLRVDVERTGEDGNDDVGEVELGNEGDGHFLLKLVYNSRHITYVTDTSGQREGSGGQLDGESSDSLLNTVTEGS